MIRSPTNVARQRGHLLRINTSLFTLLAPDPWQRAAISSFLLPHVKHVVSHDRLDRLIRNWPLAGIIAVTDQGSLVAELQVAMRTIRPWRAHIIFGEAPMAGAVADAMMGGATDYLSWPCTDEVWGERITAWSARSIEIARRVERKKRAQRLLAKLTKREDQVLSLAAEGLTSSEMGARINLRPKTVEVHVYNLLQKLGMKRRTNAIRLLFEATF